MKGKKYDSQSWPSKGRAWKDCVENGQTSATNSLINIIDRNFQKLFKYLLLASK